jgi:hypothetical protein
VQSKNKPAPTKAEREHILRIKSMACVCCNAPPPSECHEIEQGLWFTSLPVCPDCHRGSHNGPPGRGAIWRVKKLSELGALNIVVRNLMLTCEIEP